MKNVLITGASRGIGAECAKVYSKRGYRVFGIYSSDEKGAAEISGETGAEFFRLDISDEEKCEEICRYIAEKYSHIDILINNAGIAGKKLFSDTTAAERKRIIDVDLIGVMNISRPVIGNMQKNHSGAIVNVSSVWGRCGGAMEAVYSAAKAGIIGLTKALAKECAMSGIRVNCVAPGLIDTKMNNDLTKDDITALCDEIPMGRIGSAKEAAEVIFFLSSDAASYVTGQVIGVDGGWNI